MLTRGMPRIAWVFFAALFAVSPVSAAEWSVGASGQLRNNCTLECGGSVDARYKAKCPVYCGCIADEAQKLFTEAEYIDMDVKSRIPNTYNPKLPEFVKLIPICRKRAWPELVQ
jgi:hypothetical protein